MVGFIEESPREEEESVASQQKTKNSTYPESFRFDFEGFSSEFGGFSLASVEPFIDFDSIKDWIEEMQVPDSAAEDSKTGIKSGVCVESCSEVRIDSSLVDSVREINCSEKPVSVKAECSVLDEELESRDGIGRDDNLVKVDGMINSGMDILTTKAELDGSELSEIDSDGCRGNIETSHADVVESGVGVLGDKNCHKVESLGSSIAEGLEKVTLVGDEGSLVVIGSDTKTLNTPALKEDSNSNSDSDSDSDSDSESECECETSASSSSSSFSSSESDDDDEELKAKETLCKSKRENTNQIADMEEGQIVDSDAEIMVSWSSNEEEGEEEDDDVNFKANSEEFHIEDEDEDADIVKGPIKSKNELEVLPPVPPLDVTLQPCHEILPVGVVTSVLGTQVVVEGSEKHDPLSEGSILWVTETRLPLGLVDEIFGPVKTPFYIVRHNSESEVPSGIQNGTLVGFVPEFVGHVLNDKNLYQKGYDASGENDEEVLDEYDFSDDEKEAEFKRMLKMSKRGNNNQGQGSGNKKKNRNNRNRDKTWAKDQPSTSQAPTLRPSQPSQMQQHGPHVPISSQGNQLSSSPIRQVTSGGVAVQPSSHGNRLGPSPMRPSLPNGSMALPHQMQQAGILLNGLLANGIPFQQQNMSLPGGFQMNGMPQLQQNHPQNFQVPSAGHAPWQQQQHVLQTPLPNPGQCQHPFDLSQMVAGATQTPLRPSNFAAGPTSAPWLGMFGQNLSNQTPQNVGLQGANQLPAMQGQSFNSQPWLGMLGQNFSNQTPQNVGPQGANQSPAMQGQSFNSQPWLGMLGQNLSNQAPQNLGGQNSQPWLGMLGQNFSNQTPQNLGLQGAGQSLAMRGQSFNSQPPTSFRGNEGASPQFSQGSSSGRGGRGLGRKPNHHRGGRFGGGRGPQQQN